MACLGGRKSGLPVTTFPAEMSFLSHAVSQLVQDSPVVTGTHLAEWPKTSLVTGSRNPLHFQPCQEQMAMVWNRAAHYAHAERWTCKVSLSSLETWCPEKSLSNFKTWAAGLWKFEAAVAACWTPQLWQVEASAWGRTLPQLWPRVSPHLPPLSASRRKLGMHGACKAQAAGEHHSRHGHLSAPGMAPKSCCGTEHFWSWAGGTWCEGVQGSSCSPDPLRITRWKL